MARQSRCIDENVLAEREDQYWWRAGSVDTGRTETESTSAKDTEWWHRIQAMSTHKKQPVHPNDGEANARAAVRVARKPW